MAIDDLVKVFDAEVKRRLESEWSVGFHDRGLGHGDFAVILKDDGSVNLTGRLLDDFCLKCQDQDTAEHIVKLHNESLKP